MFVNEGEDLRWYQVRHSFTVVCIRVLLVGTVILATTGAIQ